MADAANPNAAQIDFWNANAGPTWVAYQEQLDRQLEPLGVRALHALAPRAGETIADIGCGCGRTTLQLAEAVGPSGAVTGLDISRPMLEVARRRAEAAGLEQARFQEADAQTAAFEPGGFDALFSRFGVMFFSDPDAAFANLRRALKPGGRLTFVCWRPFVDNRWMRTPFEAALPFLPPLPPADPLAPGPFAFADAERVRGILGVAGFERIAITPFDAEIGGSDLDQTLNLAFNVGALGSALREHPQCAGAVTDAVRAVLARHLTDNGVLMQAAVWIVEARAPGD
jgi:SAM-dependent methyltransferase